MRLDDTIAAISSAVGPAARMLVRLSGSGAIDLASTICNLKSDIAVGASRQRLHFSDLAVPAWLYIFQSPRSYTGDDLVEFHLPGNPLLARLLLDQLIAAGARMAGPGEFTARAYFNGRLDLAEAEGVAATIAAGNEQELAAARQLLAGELSRRLRPIMETVAQTLALVEAGIDFADEGISFVSAEEVAKNIDDVEHALTRLLKESARFEPLAHEPTIVLVGRPNAGKSTLLNALAGHDRAVVSPVAGTTRDALSADVALHRGIVRLIDVAGLEAEVAPTGNSPAESIERQMRDKALRIAESADVVVLVQDSTDAGAAISLPSPVDCVIRTKIDLLPPDSQQAADEIYVSARTGVGLASLRTLLDGLAFGGRSSETSFALNARHVGCIEETLRSLHAAKSHVYSGAELIAVELRDGLDALGRVLGAVTPDDLLGRIFASFCIGK